MIIYCVRHAHVRNPRNVLYGRLPGYPLSLRGRKAAKRVGRFLKDKNIEIIFVSPLQRTLETAEFIQQKIGLNVPLETKEELLELDSRGWDGLPIRVFQKEAMKAFLGDLGDVGDLREIAKSKKLYKGLLRSIHQSCGFQLFALKHESPHSPARQIFLMKIPQRLI